MSDRKPWVIGSSTIDKHYLEECFTLLNGQLTWNNRPKYHFANESKCKMFNTKYAGKIAGNLNKRGYLRVSLMGRTRYCHQIVFLMVNSYLPPGVDHIDGNRVNNSPNNLRQAALTENARNTRKHRGSSKYKGVSWSVSKQQWRVYCANPALGVMKSGKTRQKFLGGFKCEAEAAMAYDKYAETVYGPFAWLNVANFNELVS
jgi:hypothetical protein